MASANKILISIFLEKMQQRPNNTKLFRCFQVLFWTPQLTTPFWSVPLLFSQAPTYSPHITVLCHPPGEQQAFGEDRFFIGDVPFVLGSCA